MARPTGTEARATFKDQSDSGARETVGFPWHSAVAMNEPGLQNASQGRFIDRVRNRDPDLPHYLLMLIFTVPMGITLLPVGLLGIVAMLTAALGEEAFATVAVGAIARSAASVSGPAVLISFLCLWPLRAFVALKLRRRGGGA